MFHSDSPLPQSPYDPILLPVSLPAMLSPFTPALASIGSQSLCLAPSFSQTYCLQMKGNGVAKMSNEHEPILFGHADLSSFTPETAALNVFVLRLIHHCRFRDTVLQVQ